MKSFDMLSKSMYEHAKPKEINKYRFYLTFLTQVLFSEAAKGSTLLSSHETMETTDLL